MKKFYFAVTSLVLAISAAFIGYGIYLNTTSDSYIENMLESRAVVLSGTVVSHRELYPEIRIEYINLRTRMEADAIAEIDGRVEELYAAQGQEVERGAPIARIVNTDVPLQLSRADADVARAEAAYLQSANTVARNRRLAAEDAVSASELETSVSQLAASKAELDAAEIARRQIRQQSGFQVVTAPLSGSVIVLYQRHGNAVGKGMPVAMVANLAKMYFTALVDDEKIRNIAPLDGAFSLGIDRASMTEKAFDSAGGSSFDEETAFGVRISDVSPPLSEDVPFRSVTFEVDNRLEVMEIGMYADVVIRKDVPKRVLAVPLAALIDSEDPAVCVRGEDSRLALRAIKLGVRDGEYAEVTEGLAEGDVVITSGTDGLEMGIRIGVNMEEEETQ